MNDLDFTGKWLCENGETAIVTELRNGVWCGEGTIVFNDNGDISTTTVTLKWDENGNEITGNPGFNLVKNLSISWSHERAITGCV